MPNNSQLINTWDENDLLLAEEIVGDNGEGNVKLLRKTTYKYDEKDRKIKEIISSFRDNPVDAVHLETQFFYDEMDRLAKIQDFRGAQKLLFYDNAGRLIKETDAEGNVKHCTFDANGNNIRIILTIKNRQEVPLFCLNSLPTIQETEEHR